ncbi:MAG: xanthine dehydrogenase family protein subunit M, partial [Pseudomonadota bacterium]
RIAYFSVADRAIRARSAEKSLHGKTIAEGLSAAKAALDELDYTADLNASETMKRHLSAVVLERALGELS